MLEGNSNAFVESVPSAGACSVGVVGVKASRLN